MFHLESDEMLTMVNMYAMQFGSKLVSKAPKVAKAAFSAASTKIKIFTVPEIPAGFKVSKFILIKVGTHRININW